MERKDFNASLAKSIKAGIDKYQATIVKNNLKEQNGLAKLEKTLGGQDPALTGAGGNLSAGSAMTEVPNLARAEKCGPKIPKVMKKMGVLPGVEGGGTFDGNSMSSPNNSDGLKASEKKMAKEEISPIKEVPMTRLVMPEKVKGAKDGSEKIPKAIETDKSGKITKGKNLNKGAMVEYIKARAAKAGVPVKSVLGVNPPKPLPKVAPYHNPDFTNPGKVTKAAIPMTSGPRIPGRSIASQIARSNHEKIATHRFNKEYERDYQHACELKPQPYKIDRGLPKYNNTFPAPLPVTKAAIPMTSGPGLPGRALSSASKLLRNPKWREGEVKSAMGRLNPTHTVEGHLVHVSPASKKSSAKEVTYYKSPYAGQAYGAKRENLIPLAPEHAFPVTKAEPTMAKPVVKSPSSAPAGKVSTPKPTTNLAPKAPKL